MTSSLLFQIYVHLFVEDEVWRLSTLTATTTPCLFFTAILLLLWLYLNTSHGFPDWHVQTSSFPLIYIYYNFLVVLQRKFWQYQPGVCLFSSHNLIGNVPVCPPVCPSISTNIAQSSSQPHSHSSYYPPQTLCQVKLRATLQLKLSESFIFHNPHLPKHTLNLTCNVDIIYC